MLGNGAVFFLMVFICSVEQDSGPRAEKQEKGSGSCPMGAGACGSVPQVPHGTQQLDGQSGDCPPFPQATVLL